MTSEPYRDYLPDDPSDRPSEDGQETTPYLPDGVDRIIQHFGSDGWVALWERGGLDAPVAEFAGDRAAAIAWSRERTDNILIFDLKTKDLVPLTAQDS